MPEENIETGWLIERFAESGNSLNVALRVCDGCWSFDLFDRAIRFARKEDAEAVGKLVFTQFFHCWGEKITWKATEHSWG